MRESIPGEMNSSKTGVMSRRSLTRQHPWGVIREASVHTGAMIWPAMCGNGQRDYTKKASHIAMFVAGPLLTSPVVRPATAITPALGVPTSGFVFPGLLKLEFR